jgi:hypothetical protein
MSIIPDIIESSEIFLCILQSIITVIYETDTPGMQKSRTTGHNTTGLGVYCHLVDEQIPDRKLIPRVGQIFLRKHIAFNGCRKIFCGIIL